MNASAFPSLGSFGPPIFQVTGTGPRKTPRVLPTETTVPIGVESSGEYPDGNGGCSPTVANPTAVKVVRSPGVRIPGSGVIRTKSGFPIFISV